MVVFFTFRYVSTPPRRFGEAEESGMLQIVSRPLFHDYSRFRNKNWIESKMMRTFFASLGEKKEKKVCEILVLEYDRAACESFQ